MINIKIVYNINRQKTGRIIDRQSNDKLKDGEYHLSTEAIILNKKGEILLNKRSELKKKYPLLWEGVAGAIQKGETTLVAILREIREEIGISFDEKQAIFYKSERDEKSKCFKDIWIFESNIDINQLIYTDNEVIASKWISIEKFNNMILNDKIVPTLNFDKNDYEYVIKNLTKKEIIII